jgi:hypothetical protein
MTFRFIDEHRQNWPVCLLCETLDVSTAGYYAWRQRPTSARAQRRDVLAVVIRAIHTEVKARYGSRRIHAELTARGQNCCVNTVAKLMRVHGIAAKTARKFRCANCQSILQFSARIIATSEQERQANLPGYLFPFVRPAAELIMAA